MTHRAMPWRNLLLTGAVACLLAAPSWAQDKPAAPDKPAAQEKPALPPGSPLIGQPDNDAAKKLAPVAGPPIATAANKLPIDKLVVPKGFKIEVYASGMANARTLKMGDKGTLFVSSRLVDKVYAVVDRDGKREVKIIASGLYRPNGLAFKDGTLYIGELSQISKIEHIEDNLDNPPKPTVIYSDLPKDEAHGWKTLTIGPDNKLYFQVGAPCNICMPDDQHAQIRRINLDGSGMEVVARGIRQIVGMDWQPTTNILYFSENSRDWLSEDVPNDKLNRLLHPGQDNFGYPYCHQGNITDPEFGWGRSCNEFVHPIALMGPHAAVLGMRFYTGHMFPAEFRNNIILARHGSWNRTQKFGGDVVLVKLGKDGLMPDWSIPGDQRRDIVPLVTGFIQDNTYIGRPVDVLVMKDGAVLVSDDWNGAVYRVSYSGSRH